MKKQLLLGSALLLTISAFPQNGFQKPKPSGKEYVSLKQASRSDLLNLAEEKPIDVSKLVKPIGPVQPLQRSASSSSWQAISGSMNIYGMLVSNSKPLQYHPALNAVSFVHRKSFTYLTNPVFTPSTAASGAIVAEISPSIDGLSWDSTCVWNNGINWARYPQGAIYNPPGNNILSNAYVVAAGPVTQANNSLGWVGSYLASKKLNIYDSTASTAPNAQQFIPNTPSPTPPAYGAVGKLDFPRYDMTVTGDTIRALGAIFNTKDATGQPTGFRGARVLKAYLDQITGTMVWKGDSVIPEAELDNTGELIVQNQPHMAWNNSGSVGYVWFIGCGLSKTGANKGHQPIVYKSTNYGATWTLLPGPDFSSPTYSIVTSKLDPVPGTNDRVPQFNWREGFDGVVDANNKLHIVSTIISTSSSHVDSLLATFTYSNADGENYRFPHTPGFMPYIYDFTEGATSGTWNVTIVDSMTSEAPGFRTGENGVASNPWDASGGTNNNEKVTSDARIQLSRTPDGKYLLYSWAESDIAFTAQELKWNNIPNVKVRAAEIVSIAVGGNVASKIYLSFSRINTTSPGNPFVSSRAQMHYISPVAKLVSSAINTANFKLPITVSNNQNTPLTQQLPNTHWYTTAELSFTFNIGGGIDDNQLASVASSVLYPNPTKGNASVLINLKDNSRVKLEVMNLIGQVVKDSSSDALSGENKIDLNLSGLSSGIYMVNIKVGNASTTKKLIID